MAPSVYVFLHPTDRHRVSKLGFSSCLLGFKTEENLLFSPKKKAKCDLMHLDVSRGCTNTESLIFEEAKKLGAKGVFLDANEPSEDISALASSLYSYGLLVFSSVEVPDCARLVLMEKGKDRMLCPRLQKTSIFPSGKSVKTALTQSELERLIEALSPRESYSEELGSNYFSVKNRNETVFAVYDTPETFQKRLFSSDAENVFITMASVKDYLADRR